LAKIIDNITKFKWWRKGTIVW